MRFPGFIGGAYSIDSISADCQRCVNLYPEINEAGTAPNAERAALMPTPGLVLANTLGIGPIRGMHRIAVSGKLAVVSGTVLYYVDATYNWTPVGVLGTATGPVDIASNAYQVCVVDGVNGYVYDGTKTVPFFKVDGFPPADRVDFIDNYIVFNIKGSGNFGFSASNDASSVDPMDFATVEGSPDGVNSLVVSNRQVWVTGTDSTEVFVNTGDLLEPFQRIPGAFIEFGCRSAYALQKLGNSVVWLGGGPNGDGIVYRAEGYQPTRISTHAIELAIREAGASSDARAWTYQQDGHQFYCLTIAGQNTTWVYDLATGVWHERAGFVDGLETRHRADCHAFAYGQHFVGDYANGNLYTLDKTAYTDNGAPIIRERVTPHLGDDGVRVIWDYLQVEMQAGTGLDGVGQGSDPKIMMDYSHDAGYTWTPPRNASMGKAGAFLTRAIWRRMGFSRYVVVRIRVSDPVKVVFLGASIGVRKAAN